MATTTRTASPVLSTRDRIIVALDVETADRAREISRELGGSVGAFKIGLQLFTAVGPRLVREFTESGIKVFLDLKFHDIPNTVAKASVEAAKLGVWMFNVHTFGGSEMMRRIVNEVDEFCLGEEIERPIIIGVTVLTSSNEKTMVEVGLGAGVESQVVRLARLAADCGLDGVVTSPAEVRAVRNGVASPDFLTVTPGIRSTLATNDDQRRVTTFRAALECGSNYVVIGRPIIGAKDRLAAVEQFVGEAETDI